MDRDYNLQPKLATLQIMDVNKGGKIIATTDINFSLHFSESMKEETVKMESFPNESETVILNITYAAQVKVLN